jgi:hypothetical protein
LAIIGAIAMFNALSKEISMGTIFSRHHPMHVLLQIELNPTVLPVLVGKQMNEFDGARAIKFTN